MDHSIAATNNVSDTPITDAIQEVVNELMQRGAQPYYPEHISLSTFYARILQYAIEGDEGKLRTYLLDKSYKELNSIANGGFVLWNMAEDLKREEWEDLRIP